MPVRQKVEVYLFRRIEKGIEYLLLKRREELGGYWQPITGSVEPEETTRQAAVREACEEVGMCDATRLCGPVHRFSFEKAGITFEEHVFGLEVADERIVLSSEHSDLRWSSYEEALDALAWEGNREGLRRLNVELVR